MPRRILVAVLALVALAVAPGAALADFEQPQAPPPLGQLATGPRITESLRIAHDFWAATPAFCAKGVSVYSVEMQDPTFAEFTSPGGAPCTIWVDTLLLADHDWQSKVDTCDAIVHAWGHLLDLRYPDNPADPDHSPDPRSIMNSAPSTEVHACVTRFRPKARRGHFFSPVAFSTR